MTIVKREYRPSDFVDLASIEETPFTRDELQLMADMHGRQTEGLTFVVDGKIAAVGGYQLIWEGTAESWVAISKEFIDKPQLLVELKKQFIQWIEDAQLTRMQALVRADWKEGQRFLKWLGMEYEGTLRCMGPNGIDQSIYARVKPWQKQ